MKFLALAFLCAATVSANADELIVHTMSYHTQPTHQETTKWVTSNGTVVRITHKDIPYNNYNQGLGYRTESGLMFGFYENSYNTATFYAAKEFMFTKNFGTFVGLGSGYKYVTNKPVNLIGGLEYKYKLTETSTVNVLCLPPVIRGTTGVFHLALSYNL